MKSSSIPIPSATCILSPFRHFTKVCLLSDSPYSSCNQPMVSSISSEVYLLRTSASVVQRQKIRARTTAEASAGNRCIGSYCIRVTRLSTPTTPLCRFTARADMSISSYRRVVTALKVQELTLEHTRKERLQRRTTRNRSHPLGGRSNASDVTKRCQLLALLFPSHELKDHQVPYRALSKLRCSLTAFGGTENHALGGAGSVMRQREGGSIARHS
ncbi:hypothetical protein BKA70DRAFT_1314098 [Coprinopsis sp. MPI-PUGE-AT-0042]|nr:hypothetical protein BKA70DRAFT_1314098 [Coprinopsis sp. MPI-PUGE-AT-0042]